MSAARRSLLVHPALLATGAAGLIYQVAWQRYLGRVTGSDWLATAVTLAVFLTGLSLGYALCGAWSGRVRRPVRVYAALEGAIGLWGVCFPAWFAVIDRWALHWPMRSGAGLAAGGVLAAVLLILPPALLMGATVPFMTQAAAGDGSRVGSVHALVYGVNTAGAVAGALAGGFWMLPALGLPGAVRTAAACNFIGALLLLPLGAGTVALAGARAGESAAGWHPSRRALIALAFLSGAATMLLENCLARYLALSVGGTPYVFAMIVAVFVAAIATGSFAVSRMTRVPAGALAAVFAGAGLWLSGLYVLLDRAPWCAHLLRIAFTGAPPAFWLYHGALLLALALLIGPAAALAGAGLPLLFSSLKPAAGDAGRASGRLLAWNAAGSLAGSLLGGFVLLHWLDLARVFLVAPVLFAAGAFIALPPLPRARRLLAGAAAAAPLALLLFRPLHEPARFAWGAYRNREPFAYSYSGAAEFHRQRMATSKLLAQRDGPLASVAVMETDLPENIARSFGQHAGPARALFVNGKSESSTRYDRVTVRLSADLGALFADRRERALVIGLGTGSTAGELTLYPELRSIEVAEISPEVVATLPSFSPDNRDPARDPRFRLLRADALLVLRRGDERWDVISSEPSNPWVAGVDQLFSREFYATVRRRLAPGGVFVQWFHLYESTPEITAMIANTLASEFPELHAFRGTPNDILVIATLEPLDEARWARTAALLADHPALRASLAEIDIPAIETLRAREIPGYDRYARRAAGARLNTLDHPRLHYLAARAFFNGSTVEEHEISDLPSPQAIIGGMFNQYWDPNAKNPGDAFARSLIEQAAQARERAGLPGNRPWSAPASSPGSSPASGP